MLETPEMGEFRIPKRRQSVISFAGAQDVEQKFSTSICEARERKISSETSETLL